jgi:crotonobetainyl-CoA:carnitine CoA-transferase CaiB-like acyl-CoA transferase
MRSRSNRRPAIRCACRVHKGRPYALADKLCGVYLAAVISAAVVRRERSGEGQVVHLPMMATLVAFNIVDHMWA